jgi:type II secretory pathway pseudopilin PulG
MALVPAAQRGLRKSASRADDDIVAVRQSRNPRPRNPRPGNPRRQTRRAQNGFVLIATSIALTILLALAVLGIDIGRMYVIRAELQSFTDAAALSAAMELDGTDAGFKNARAGAGRLATGPHAMRWNLGTQPITNIVTGFSPDNKTWQEQPKQGGDYRFVRVVASEPAPVIFLKIFQPLGLGSSTVASASVAAKTENNARLIR